MAQSGASHGADSILARAHHGSVSREQRMLIEEELKSGRLPAVVATSSLELGIDMGAVDLVVQVESPPSVASGLQRVGRAGHQVGAVSKGVIFPKFRGDLVQTAVVAERMRAGQIEALHVPRNPLDVLAQQVVAMLAVDTWHVDDLLALVRRASPFATLPQSAYDAVLDMLAGRYPSDAFAELRPRIVWDRVTGELTPRPGAQRLAVTSGGTIPDRGLFGVFLVGEKQSRVGELDEEMVYESRVGDVFALGSTSWRIEDITHDRVLVSPAPGQPGRLPFWKGDALGRPAELGQAVGAFVRELGALDPDAARARVTGRRASTPGPPTTCSRYLDEQRTATGHVPDDRTIVVERFRDELGDWRLVVHSPYGAQVHAPWALALAARLRERHGLDVQAMHADDGIVIRLPETDIEGGEAFGGIAVLTPEEVEPLVTAEVGGSALFASRFRECAGRALLLPRRQPDRRSPLWQQRQRSAQLLSVASEYTTFPIVLETMREVLQDVFDVPGLVRLMRDLESRAVRIVEVETTEPSPFARSLLFGYVGAFIYEGDSPLAERKAAALSLDSTLLAELLGQAELRELLDPAALAQVEQDLQRLSEDRRARDAEGTADLLRLLGSAVHRRGPRARRHGRLAGRARGRPPRHPGTGGRRGALGGHRGRRPPARRPRRPSAGRDPGGVPRAGGRPAGRPGRALRPYPRALHRGRRGPPLRPRHRRRHRRAAPAVRQRTRRRGRVPPGRRRHRVVRRRGAAPAASALARRPAPGGRTGAARGAGALPARLAGRRRRPARASTACCASSSSCRAPLSPHRPSNASCSRPASPATPPPCSMS